MKKSSFAALILGTISGVFFSLGMCMMLLTEWGARTQGIVCTVIGLALGLVTLLVWRRMVGKAPVKFSGKLIGGILLGAAGAIMLGIGMCLCMVFGRLIIGIAVGIVGIIALIMLIPLTKGLRD